MSFFHAWNFTHFEYSQSLKPQNKNNMSKSEKLKALFFGISNPRPYNSVFPSQKYQQIKLKSNKIIDCWHIKNNNSKGTVILFHGYRGCKSGMLDKGNLFLEMGYSILLIDFMGSADSEGNQSTIGYFESEEVKTAFNYIKTNGEKNIILFGTSMGAVAIMKALNDYQLNCSSIIIECPFGSMLETAKARFRILGIGSFPMANFLVFWGGLQNGFNAFSHNPTEYAKKIRVPTLLLYGEKDSKVSKREIVTIFNNLKGNKVLKTYQNAGHENYLIKHKTEWVIDVTTFLSTQ